MTQGRGSDDAGSARRERNALADIVIHAWIGRDYIIIARFQIHRNDLSGISFSAWWQFDLYSLESMEGAR